MKSYPFSMARMFGVPLAIHPTKGKVIAQALSKRLNITSIQFNDSRAEVSEWEEEDFSEPSTEGGYDVVNGVAIIPIEGTLVHKGSSLRPHSGMLGYNAIAHNFTTAIRDEEVRAVVLACNSAGGEVSGCFDLVDLIHSARGIKPVWSILDDMAFSACYAIASAADRIIVPRTGGTGSVGVITLHADHSKELEGDGIAVTIFQYGDRKADGNPYFALSKEAAERYQEDIDTMGDLFVETVSRNLGIKPAKVRATQAATYLGAKGVEIGFAHAVMAPDEAFRSLLSELGQ